MNSQSSTHDIFWGVGGVLVSFGMLRRSPQSHLVLASGLVILGVKLTEWVTCLSSEDGDSHEPQRLAVQL